MSYRERFEVKLAGGAGGTAGSSENRTVGRGAPSFKVASEGMRRKRRGVE
jgi:hypothetical protein